MPYLDVQLDFLKLAIGYKWSANLGTPEAHKEELKTIFQRDPSLTNSGMRKLLKDTLGQPERFMRSPEEQREARLTNQKMQDAMFDQLVTEAATNHRISQLERGPEVISALGRCSVFFRPEANDEDRAFNDRLMEAALNYKENPEPFQTMVIGEINALRDKLGFNDPENFKKLGALTDRELAENFADLSRYRRILFEAADSGSSANWFTDEQRTALQQEYVPLSYLQNLDKRFTAIVNPYYVDLDLDRLQQHRVQSGPLYETMLKHAPDPETASDYVQKNPLYQYMANADTIYSFNANGLWGHIAALKPELAHHFQDKKGKDALMMSLTTGAPFVATGTDGKDYVVTNKLVIDKVPTAEEYTRELLDRAVKADKWLLTGSKQFDAMMKANRALMEAREQNKSAGDLVDLSVKLEEAAKAYLEYKKVDLKMYMGHSSLHGKNAREQSRLEVAADLLNFAKAQSAVSIEAYKAEEAAAKTARQQQKNNAPASQAGGIQNNDKEAKPKPEEEAATQKEIAQNRTRLGFAQNFAEKAGDLLQRQAPTLTVKKENGEKETTSLMAQDDFAALCALACGSDKTYYKTEKTVRDGSGNAILDAKGKTQKTPVTVENKNPEETMKAMLQAVQKGQQMSSEMQKMVRAAQSVTFHSLKSGNYEALGKALADGVRMNNKLMQEAKGFTAEFCACAQLNAKALSILNNPLYPQLRAEANKYLTPADLQIAQAGKTLNDMHIDGLMTQSSLFSRCGIQDGGKTLSTNEFKQDLAKVCHMYGTEWQLAGGKLNLSAINPQEYPKQAETISQGLANDPKFNDFLNSIKSQSLESQIAAIGNPKRMYNLFESVALNAQQNVQQSQPQFEFQLQAAPAQPQQQPQQPGPV